MGFGIRVRLLQSRLILGLGFRVALKLWLCPGEISAMVVFRGGANVGHRCLGGGKCPAVLVVRPCSGAESCWLRAELPNDLAANVVALDVNTKSIFHGVNCPGRHSSTVRVSY